jgi:transposase
VPEARNAVQNIEKRFSYANEYMMLNEEDLIFVDEMGVSCSFRCSYGRSERGTKAKKVVRTIRSKNFSVSAGISKRGIVYYETICGAFNGSSFTTFINNLITNSNLSGKTIIMDNCSIHKIESIRNLIEQSGNFLLFLPPYSPQLNPIEEFFSKWKLNVKTCNSSTITDLYAAINNGHLNITQDDCLGWFSHVRSYALKSIRREEL